MNRSNSMSMNADQRRALEERIERALSGIVEYIADKLVMQSVTSQQMQHMQSNESIVLLIVYVCDAVVMRDIALALHLGRQQTSRIVEKLVQGGMLERVENHEDRRLRELRLSAQSLALFTSFEDPGEHIIRQIQSSIQSEMWHTTLEHMNTYLSDLERVRFPRGIHLAARYTNSPLAHLGVFLTLDLLLRLTEMRTLHQLSNSQFAILLFLFRQKSSSIKNLATFIETSISTLSRIIEQQVQMGLVNRSNDTEDRRYKQLQLTSRGYELIEDIFQVHKATTEYFIARIDDQESELFAQLLELELTTIQREGIVTAWFLA